MKQLDKNRRKAPQIQEFEDIPKDTKTTIKRLLSRLARQKGKMILIVISAMLSCFIFALTPLAVGVAIDNLILEIQNYQGMESLMPIASRALLMPAAALVILSVISSLLAYIQQYVVSSVGETLTLSLRQDVSEKITRLPLRFFDAHKTGDILSRTTNDLEKVSEVMQVGLMQFISSIFTITVTIAAMLYLSPFLTVIVLAAVAVSAIATGFVSSKSQEYFAENQAVLGSLGSRVEELYSGNMIIKVFNQQTSAIDTVLELNERQYQAAKKAQFANYAIYPAIRFLNQLGFVATAVAGGFMVIQGRISVGTIQAFLQYVNQIAEPVTQASYVINSLQAAIAGAERVFELLDEEEEDAVPETIPALKPASVTGRVKFHHVRFGYTPEKILMKDISLEVKPNEIVAIVGPTGGGKTTLINLLMRFYELNGGKITIDGTDIKTMPYGSLRRMIGMVLQDTWLFKGTVAQNISYGKMDATRDEIIAAAKAARCDHFIRTLPQGYDTIISSDAANISQGQMQLLTIARAMLSNPAIMILDEATSSVDTRTEVEIQKAMNRLMKGKTSFVIAHRLSTIKNADLILVVKDGDIIESGSHAALLAQNGFYTSLYNSQFEAA